MQSNKHNPELFASGFTWPEAPRWNNNALWISDVHNFCIAKVVDGEPVERVLNIPQRPAGIDFQTDGRLLIGTSLEPYMLSFDITTGDSMIVANLEGQLSGNLNDMITAQSGWSWIGDTGFTFGVDEPVCAGKIFAFHPEHGVRVVVNDCFFPNGLVLSADQKSLFISETFGKKISLFDIIQNGGLSNRRVHAELPGHPDGLCADAHGNLWVPLLMEEKFIKIDKSGSVVDEIKFAGRKAIACMFGGKQGKDLFLCTARVTPTENGPEREGTVHIMRDFD